MSPRARAIGTWVIRILGLLPLGLAVDIGVSRVVVHGNIGEAWLAVALVLVSLLQAWVLWWITSEAFDEKTRYVVG